LNGVTTAEPITITGADSGGNLPRSSAGALREVAARTSTVTGLITPAGDATIGVDGGGIPNVSRGINVGSHTLTINSAGATNVNSAITGSGALIVNGSQVGGTVNLSVANSYTGPTTVGGGTLTVSGATGALASTSLNVGLGATLKLDNDGLASPPNRLPDTASLILSGGTFLFQASTAANTTETIATDTSASGHSTIQSSAGGSFTTQLVASSLARNPDATVAFVGTALGTTNKILFGSAPSTVGNGSGIIPYALVNNPTTSAFDFATYDAV